MFTTTSLFALLALVIAGGVSFWVTRVSLSPLHGLTAAIDNVANGDYTTRTGFSARKGEIGQIARSITSLCTKLEDAEKMRDAEAAKQAEDAARARRLSEEITQFESHAQLSGELQNQGQSLTRSIDGFLKAVRAA